MAVEFVGKDEIKTLLGLKHSNSVRTYHRKWTEGIHFYKPPGGNKRGYRYNLPLIKHWIQCGEDKNCREHQSLIRQYQRQKSANKRRAS